VPRSVWKGPFFDRYLLKKAATVKESGRKDVIKTWSRRSTILPQFVGVTFGVHNGHKFIPVFFLKIWSAINSVNLHLLVPIMGTGQTRSRRGNSHV